MSIPSIPCSAAYDHRSSKSLLHEWNKTFLNETARVFISESSPHSNELAFQSNANRLSRGTQARFFCFAPGSATVVPHQGLPSWARHVLLLTGEQRDKSPQNLEWGDTNANCPTRIFSYRYTKERSVAFKILQNPFPAKPLGELTRLSQSLSAPMRLWRSTCTTTEF